MCLLTSLPMHGGFPRATARRMPPLRPFARQNVCRGPTESVRYTGADRCGSTHFWSNAFLESTVGLQLDHDHDDPGSECQRLTVTR